MISQRSEGVRSSALDMFYLKDSTFDVLRKKYGLASFFVEKKLTKEISQFFWENFEKFSTYLKLFQKKLSLFPQTFFE